MSNRVIFVIGVSGSGKSTIGQLLSDQTGIPFFDADDFHPSENIEKMKAGIPLNDDDRKPWLLAINQFCIDQLHSHDLIFACSALKETYRELLSKDIAKQCEWILLTGDEETIAARMALRGSHYMPVALLKSQIDTLEIPSYGKHLSIDEEPEVIVKKILDSQLQHMKNEFGLIGLGVMGKSLARNLAQKGFSLSLYNRRVEKSEEEVAVQFIDQHKELQSASGFEDLGLFVESLKAPRRIMLMVNAGTAIDSVISHLEPLLSEGDLIIDGGNSHYKDTDRRNQDLQKSGILYIGTGVSGGEKGALEGPAIMPGGASSSYELVRPYFENIAAKNNAGLPCCAHIGEGGAGHFVKMVHNGIEYAEMQLIAEVYSILRWNLKLSLPEISEIFSRWNQGKSSSYLLEISSKILIQYEGDAALIDLILDKAGNKGTGSWTTIAACELGIPIPTLTAALYARYLSSFKSKRTEAAKIYPSAKQTIAIELDHLEKAYHTARIINHHQGFELIQEASKVYHWNINLSLVCQIWTNGCIIRSALMEDFVHLFNRDTGILENYKELVSDGIGSLQSLISAMSMTDQAIPCLSSTLQYFMYYKTAVSDANMIQAQRDFFGAHTYQRVDDPSGKKYHTQWED